MHKKHMSKKAIALLVSLILVMTMAVGTTIAFLVDVTDPLLNVFTPSEVTVEVNETFDGNVKSDVSIQNTGDTTAYIRASVVINWQKADGEVFGQPITAGDYDITLGEGWLKDSDGFYYWTQPVEAGANTGILIEEITPVIENVPADYYLCVEILASGIQSEPDRAVNDAWPAVKVDADGTTLIKAS